MSEGLPYSSRTICLFGILPIVEKRREEFICRFVRNGEEVYRVGFHELCSWLETREGSPTITRHWRWPVWRETQILKELAESNPGWNDLNQLKLKLFDLNKNGKLDPEESAAWNAAANVRAERAAELQLSGKDFDEDLEFDVIRRLIIVEAP